MDEQVSLLLSTVKSGVVYGEDVVEYEPIRSININYLRLQGFFVSNQLNFLYEWI